MTIASAAVYTIDAVLGRYAALGEAGRWESTRRRRECGAGAACALGFAAGVLGGAIASGAESSVDSGGIRQLGHVVLKILG